MEFDADYKAEKKKTHKKVLKVFLILGLLFAGIIAYGVYWVFFDWSRFKQELIAESTSPNGTYTVNAYLSNTHATTPYTILGELVFNKDKAEASNLTLAPDNLTAYASVSME